MAMILALYVCWSRLNHLQFLQREPMLTGILGVEQSPMRSTFGDSWDRFTWWCRGKLLEVTRCLRQRVWEAAHVAFEEVTLDTDTTVQTVYGRRKTGVRKGYNPTLLRRQHKPAAMLLVGHHRIPSSTAPNRRVHIAFAPLPATRRRRGPDGRRSVCLWAALPCANLR
jgi:hypothetical protein